jgi:hypothetical protein
MKILLNMLRIRNVQKDNKLSPFVNDFDDDNRIGVEVSKQHCDSLIIGCVLALLHIL